MVSHGLYSDRERYLSSQWSKCCEPMVRSHCVTHWCVWFCLYFYWQQWIGLSDCDIAANCDKIRYSYTFYVINVKCDILYMDVMWQRGSWCWILWVVIQGNMVIILPLSDAEVQAVSWRQIRWKVYPRELKKKLSTIWWHVF